MQENHQISRLAAGKRRAPRPVECNGHPPSPAISSLTVAKRRNRVSFASYQITGPLAVPPASPMSVSRLEGTVAKAGEEHVLVPLRRAPDAGEAVFLGEGILFRAIVQDVLDAV